MEAWARLTSDAPVSRIRATVRAGRDEMRATLLSWLPDDLRGCRLLDAGCGTGALAVEAARRGAQVVAIDVAPTLIELARERTPRDLGAGSIEFRVGDMLDPALGAFRPRRRDGFAHPLQRRRLRSARSPLWRRAPAARSSITYAPRTPALDGDACGRAAVPALGTRAGDPADFAKRRCSACWIDRRRDLRGWRSARTQRDRLRLLQISSDGDLPS